MKALIILLLIFSSVEFGFSQSSKVNEASALANPPDGSAAQLGKAKDAIDAAIANVETKDAAKTWFVRGMVHQKLAEDISGIFKSQFGKDAELIAFDSYKKAIELGKKEQDKEYDEYVAKRKEKGKPVDKERTDAKFRYRDEAEIIGLLSDKTKQHLRNDLLLDLQKRFPANDYEGALKTIEACLTIDTLSKSPTIDTMLYFYGGVCADNLKLKQKAIKYYAVAIANNYNLTNAYNYTIEAYKAIGDTASALKTIEDAINKLPKEQAQGFFGILVNYYVEKGQTDKAIDICQKATQDPNVHESFFFTFGDLLERKSRFDEAIVQYQKAIDKNPEYLEPYYNLGKMKVEKANVIINAASSIPAKEVAKYNAEIDKAIVEFKASLPFFEKAYGINPKDEATLRALRQVYVRLKEKDKSYEAKHAKIEAELKALIGN